MNSSHTNTHTLTCRMQAEPVALERLCQVARIRGFHIEQMEVRSDTDALEIRMRLSGERSIDMLRAQLEKLHTVCTLQIGVGVAPVSRLDRGQACSPAAWPEAQAHWKL